MPQAKRLPTNKSKSLVKTREEQIEAQASSMMNEATLLVSKVNALKHADINIEKALVDFRYNVIKVGENEVHKAFDDIVSTAKINYDKAKAKLTEYLTPWQNADLAIRAGLNAYYSMVERVHREEQEKADREQAEQERLASIEREQERAKLEHSIQKKIDSLPANASPVLIDKYLSQLEELDGPQPIAPPVIVSKPETTGMMNQQDNWKGMVEPGQEMNVLRQIVAGNLPLSIIEFRQPELSKLAKLYKLTKKFDGLKFWNQPFTKGVGGK